jgi:hypothetical protein
MRCFMPGRVGLDVSVARLAEADVVEDFVRALHRVAAGSPASWPQYATNDTGVHAGNVRVALGHVADAARMASGACATSMSSTVMLPLVRLDEPEQRLQHRALAGAVGPEQADRPLANFAETFFSA